MATEKNVLNQYPIMSWPFPRILVAFLIERTISYADLVFPSVVQIAAQGPVILSMPYMRTDLARNKAAMELLRGDFTHLLMLDIDHVHPADIVQRLARWVVSDPKQFQIVGGLNFRRSEPYDPCAYKMGEDNTMWAIEWDKDTTLMEVDRLGTGSILIAREVFETIPPPWFTNDYSQAWRDAWPGEDIGFSKLCNKAGIKMWVDCTVTSPHIAPAIIDNRNWEAWKAKNPDMLVKGEQIMTEVRYAS